MSARSDENLRAEYLLIQINMRPLTNGLCRSKATSSRSCEMQPLSCLERRSRRPCIGTAMMVFSVANRK